MAWIPHHLSSAVLRGDSNSAGVVQRVVPQHGDEDAQPAIDNTAQGPAVSMAARPQLAVIRGTGGVVLHTGPPPVVRGPAQLAIARAAHRDQPPFAARARHRGGAHVRAESVIIAVRERLGRFSEHRDSDCSSDSRQGFENGDVAMLAAFLRVTRALPELLQELLKLSPTRVALRMHNLEAREDQLDLRFHGFCNAGRVWKARRLQSCHHIGGPPSPNPMGAQQMIDARPSQTPLRRRRRRRREQRPEPRLIGPGAQRQDLGHEPMQLAPQLIGQASKFGVQIIFGARELAELHDDRILVPDRLERRGIRSSRVGEHPRIAPVVFCARHRMPVPKATELLRIDGEHEETARKTGIPGATAKDKENRRIPFNPKGRLAAILERRAELGPDAYVFGSATGTYQPNIQTAWETLRLLANGLEPRSGRQGGEWNREQLRRIDLRWHDLRHEGACRLLADGVDIRIIQLMLGHASIQQTQRYLNVTDEELRRGLEVSWKNEGRPLRLASGA